LQRLCAATLAERRVQIACRKPQKVSRIVFWRELHRERVHWSPLSAVEATCTRSFQSGLGVPRQPRAYRARDADDLRHVEQSRLCFLRGPLPVPFSGPGAPAPLSLVSIVLPRPALSRCAPLPPSLVPGPGAPAPLSLVPIVPLRPALSRCAPLPPFLVPGPSAPAPLSLV